MSLSLRIQARCHAITAIVLLGVVLASCDHKESVGPSPTSPSVTRLELIAPGSIPPGESVQLTANVIKSDNPIENVTAQAQWLSSNARILEVGSTGIATGVANGEVVITVRYQSRSATTRTVVLPPGTYRLSGKVTDSGFGLGGVTLTVGTLKTITNPDGTYVLYGVGGQVRVRAQRLGYHDQVAEIDLTDHRTFDFEMVTERPRSDVRGSYTLSLTAAPCANGAQLELPTRSSSPTWTGTGPN